MGILASGQLDRAAQTDLHVGAPEHDLVHRRLEHLDPSLAVRLRRVHRHIGAAQQGLSFSEANYTTMGESLTASLSTEDDTDIAAEITKLLKKK